MISWMPSSKYSINVVWPGDARSVDAGSVDPVYRGNSYFTLDLVEVRLCNPEPLLQNFGPNL
jgi:hypothetical protein